MTDRTWKVKKAEKDRPVPETDVLVCQKCGRATIDNAETRKEWLVDFSRNSDSHLIVRCPEHITEWAMRQTWQGRTTSNRQKAAQGRSKTFLGRPGMEPVPARFKGAQLRGEN
jgi:hypothetical protein